MNDKICGYTLDKQQQAVILDESKHVLVVAGAGSGKTLTIIGKVYYLIKYKNINPKEILCISFTKASANSLKEKIKRELSYDMPVYTFHKLGLLILKDNNNGYSITDSDVLKNIIYEFFNVFILNSKQHMQMVLNYFHIYFFENTKQRYLKLLDEKRNEMILIYNLIETFIKLFKCNNYKLEDFNVFHKQINKGFNYFKYKREKIFLILILIIYIKYIKYLEENNEIDFDDIIIESTKLVKERGINSNYKYIIVDEYQDTSLIRFELINAILEKTGAKLMVVGDDFQSIYRFTGCDISLFLDFNKYFNDSKIFKIETTYRNSQELISIAGSFVMKNPKQINKHLVSNKHLKLPIKIVYYQKPIEMFLKLIKKIYKESQKSILVLGRNNNDIKRFIDNRLELKGEKVIYLENKEIDITYLTVHRSKGLEDESVIVINLENATLGFPNKLKDNELLRLVSRDKEKYLYAEERRLFYVALTRTKGYVYLLTQKNKTSIFIEELLINYKKQIEIINC